MQFRLHREEFFLYKRCKISYHTEKQTTIGYDENTACCSFFYRHIGSRHTNYRKKIVYLHAVTKPLYLMLFIDKQSNIEWEANFGSSY